MDTSQWRAPPHKRIACDRCHARKLRCLREISISNCRRCIQDGCVCTYSPPLKSGRPKKARPTVSGDLFDLDATAHLHNAADQSQTPLSSKSTTRHCPTSSSVENMISPPSFLPDMLSNSEVEIAGASMDMSDVRSFFDTGSAAMDIFNEIPSLSATSDNTPWSDLLQTNAQSSHSTDLPTYPSEVQIHSHILAGLKTPPADDDTCRNILLTLENEGKHPIIPRQSNILSQIASSHLDIHTHKVDINNSNESRSGLLEKLSQLQHELIQSTRADTSDDVAPPSTGRPSACNNGKDHLSRKHPVNAILRPGQELIGIIYDLLAKCEGKAPDQTEHCLDHATLVLFVITPLSLLLSTYERLLKEISSAIHPWSSHYPNGNMTTGSDGARHLSDAHHQTTQQNSPFQSRPINSRDGSRSYPTLLADNLSINLGEMNLDHQTQLVVVVTVINRHLIYLESALHQYHSRRIDGRITKDISERLFTTLLSEMRASIKLLKAEAKDMI